MLVAGRLEIDGEMILASIVQHLMLFTCGLLLWMSSRWRKLDLAGSLAALGPVVFVAATYLAHSFWSENASVFLVCVVLCLTARLHTRPDCPPRRFWGLVALLGLALGLLAGTRVVPMRDVPPELEAVCLKSMALKKGLRYRGADALSAKMVSIINDHQLAVTLQALSQNTATKVLTAPRVIALNNKEAQIKLTRESRYPTDWEPVTSTTTTDQTATTTTTLIPRSWNTQQLGYTLKVFPSVGSDMRTITLQVIPEITDLDSVVNQPIVTTTPTGQQQVTNAQMPNFKTSTLTVEAVVDDGQTIVVGGLSRDDATEGKKAVPLLEKVPALGNLFRSKDNSRDRSCLLIFVTACIQTPRNRHYAEDPVQAREDVAKEEAIQGQNVPVDIMNEWMGDPKK